jgi:peptidoglycan/xylan/chitin deacetylase (PgdA/CDA1 family)
MIDQRLRKNKFIFIFIIIPLIFFLAGGIYFLHDNYYLGGKFTKMQLRWLECELQYHLYEENSFWKTALAFFDNNETVTIQSKKADAIPVLLYHGIIDDNHWKPDGVNISRQDFQNQMFALKQAGYEALSFSDFYQYIVQDRNLPEKSVLITFDDSRSDSYYQSDPIFRTLGFRATMFVITSRSFTETERSEFHLSEDELKKMLASGRWELESHTSDGHDFIPIDSTGTRGHFLTNKKWLTGENRLETEEEYRKRIYYDLLASKMALEKIGSKNVSFAYPFGDFGQESQNFPQSSSILREVVGSLFPLIFRQVDTGEYPGNYPGNGFRLIKRINIDSEISPEKLIATLSGNEGKILPLEDKFYRNQGWIAAWGKAKISNSLLLTGATESEDSSLIFLNGTAIWTNYNFHARANLIKGDSFSLVFRYNDGNNYLSCDYSGETISLNARIGGMENTLGEYAYPKIISAGKELDVGTNVEGDVASCFIDGQKVLEKNIGPALNHGGIGFKTWNGKINNSSLLVEETSVSL